MDNKEIFQRILESTEEKNGLKVGEKYEISLEKLRDEFGDKLSFTTIDADRHGEDDFLSLYDHDNLVLMDGESAKLKKIDNDKFIFVDDYDENEFALSKEEADIGTVASEASKDDEPKPYSYFQDILDKAKAKQHEHAVYSDEEMKGKLRVVTGEKPIKDNPLPGEIDRDWESEEVVNEVLGVETAWQKADNAIRQVTQDIREVFKKAPFGAKFEGLEYSGHTGFQVTIYTTGPKCVELAEGFKKKIQEMLDEKGYSDINIEIEKDQFTDEDEEEGCYLTVYLNEF